MEILILLFWLACGFGAMAVANQRGGSSCAGLALGFLLGPIGLALSFAVFEGKACPKCTQTIPGNAERCPKCQFDLVTKPSPAVAAPVNPAVKKCPDCAEEVKFEARKCRFCGFEFQSNTGQAFGESAATAAAPALEIVTTEPVSQIEAPPDSPSAAANGRTDQWLAPLVCCLVALIMILVIVGVLSN